MKCKHLSYEYLRFTAPYVEGSTGLLDITPAVTLHAVTLDLQGVYLPSQKRDIYTFAAYMSSKVPPMRYQIPTETPPKRAPALTVYLNKDIPRFVMIHLRFFLWR